MKRDSWRWQAMANCARNYVLVQWSMKTAQGDGAIGPMIEMASNRPLICEAILLKIEFD